MFKGFFKIEEMWGEKRSHQVIGGVLFVCTVVGSIIYKIYW